MLQNILLPVCLWTLFLVFQWSQSETWTVIQSVSTEYTLARPFPSLKEEKPREWRRVKYWLTEILNMFGILWLRYIISVAVRVRPKIDCVFSPCRKEKFTPSRRLAAQVKVWCTMTWSALTTWRTLMSATFPSGKSILH